MSAYSDAVLALGPDLYWALDAATKAEDLSGNGRHGKASGGITLGGHGSSPILGETKSTDFDNVNDAVVSTYDPFVNGATRTFSGWAWRDTSAGRDTLFAGTGSGFKTPGVILEEKVNTLRWATDWSIAGSHDYASWPGNEQWVFWALVVNDATDKSTLYVNGVLIGGKESALGELAAGNFQVGVLGASEGLPFDGKQAHVAVFEEAIAAGAIADLYTIATTAAPEVTTGKATEVADDTATLNGMVDANGAATIYWFEYGTTEAYGSATTPAEAGKGSEPVAVDDPIAGLKSGTTYHFRLVAESAGRRVNGKDGTLETERSTISAARVTSEPVDDRLFVEIRHADGTKTRWAADEPDASGIPQGINVADSAPGGYRDASFTLLRDPRLSWPDLAVGDDVFIYGRTKPLGRNAFEGQIAHLPSELGDSVSITVNVVGHQVLLDEDESFHAIYVALGFEGWEDPPLARREAMVAVPHSTGKIAVSADDALVWDAPVESLPANEDAEVEYLGSAGLPIAKVGYRGTRKGGDWSKFEAATLYGGDVEAITPGNETVELTLDNTIRMATFVTARRYLMLRVRAKEAVTPSAGTQQRIDRLALYGDHGLTLRDIEGELPGVYAHDALAHMLSTGAPELKYRVAADGTIVPNTSFVVPDLAFPERGKVSEAILKLNAYFLNNFAVWDGKEFHWHPWDPDRLTWRATVAGGAHWSPAGRQLQTQLNGLIVIYPDHQGRRREAGPPGSGCDVESELLRDTDPSNPYTRRGRKRWGELTVDFPLAYSSTAIQVGFVALLEQRLPQRAGTLVVRPRGLGHVPQLEHPTLGPVPLWAARSGEYTELDGWPEPEPFRTIEKDYDDSSKTLVLQLETAAPRMSAILESVGVRMKGRF